MHEQKPTGYSSIDKPWNKYYRSVPIREIEIHQTIYELVFNSNKDNMDDAAIGYLGNSWTFSELKEMTDRTANAFYNSGLRIGDTVLVGLSNFPEALITLLSLNKLGVVSKWFDIRANENDIKEYAMTSRCKVMVALNNLIPKVERILDETYIEKVITVSPGNSLPRVKKALYNFKTKIEGGNVKLPKNGKYISWANFVIQGKNSSHIPCVIFDEKRPSVMIQSSGTTGKPKTIVHSDLSCTSCVRKIAYSDIPLGRGKQLLDVLPPWIAYGLGNAIVLPIAMGTKVELYPTFDPNSVFKNIGKFTIAFAAPFHYRYLRDNFSKLSAKQKRQFDKVECLVSGGDKISSEENKEFEELFHTSLVNGYGNNESWGVLTVNPTKHNKYGTVGIPKYDEIIISYDNETGQELKYGETGEICSLTDTMFLGYENNNEETANVKKLHSDGKTWVHTGDLGYVDEDGFITLGGRARRVITRGGFKISAYYIEDVISSHEAVKECVAVEVEDEVDEHVPMVYISLKEGIVDSKDSFISDIKNKCCNELKEYEIPKHFRIVEKLPYTNNGKYDFRLLEQWGNEYVGMLRGR